MYHASKLVALGFVLLHLLTICTCKGSALLNAQNLPPDLNLNHLDALSFILQQTTQSADPPAGVSSACHQRFGWQYILAQRQNRVAVCGPRPDDGSHANLQPLVRKFLESAGHLQQGGHGTTISSQHGTLQHLPTSSLNSNTSLHLTPDVRSDLQSGNPRALADSLAGASQSDAIESITSGFHIREHTRKLAALSFSVANIAFPSDEPPPGNSWTRTAAASSHKLSSTDCYLQPHQHATHGPRGGQSLCLSRNLILDSCAFSKQLTKASRFPRWAPCGERICLSTLSHMV